MFYPPALNKHTFLMTESKISIKLGFYGTENWQNVNTTEFIIAHVTVFY